MPEDRKDMYPKAKQDIDGYVHRTTITLTSQQQHDLQQLVPWGTLTKVMSCFVDEFIGLIKKAGEGNRDLVVGAILSGKLSILDVIRTRETK